MTRAPNPRLMLHTMLTGTGDPGWLQFRWWFPGGITDDVKAQWVGPRFLPTSEQRVALRWFTFEDCAVGAVPRRRDEPGFLMDSWVLWARLETARHAEALARFRPVPSLVVRTGKSPHRTALWALSEPLNLTWLERANRRVAHRLGTRKRHGDAEFMFPPVGATVVNGRARPSPVWAEHVEPVVYRAREVVGHLQEAPDPDAWRRAA